MIDNLIIQHADKSETEDETEAIIFTGEKLSLTDLKHADTSKGDKTMKEVFDTLDEEQKTVVYAMIAHALEGDPGGDEGDTKIIHSSKGGKIVKKKCI